VPFFATEYHEYQDGGGIPATAPWARAFANVCDAVVDHRGERVLLQRCRNILLSLLNTIAEQDLGTAYEEEKLSDGFAQLRLWIPCDDGMHMVIAIKVESEDAV
jgi:hypothetical protein